jgi:2-polyprenyl-6-methoxyphenol hydroxylase-like FAD-dependent oxidoreductase
MNREFDILIGGGGMVGLTIARLLAQGDAHGQLRITVVDAGKRPSFSPDQDVSLRVSAIASGTASLLDRAGAWERIAGTRACPYRDMKVWDAAGSVEGPETLRFDAAEFAVPELGFIVENVLIQDALLAVLDSTRVSINYETRIKSVKKCGERYVVEYGSGETMTPDLLIGADGASSFIRNSACITVKSWKFSPTCNRNQVIATPPGSDSSRTDRSPCCR